MNTFKKVLIALTAMFLSSAYAIVKTPSALTQINNATINRYTASTKLQQTVKDNTRQLSAKWIQVFDQNGMVIAYSKSPQQYQYQTTKKFDQKTVSSVLRTGRPVMYNVNHGRSHIEFYPVKINQRTIGVVKVVK
jgi:hypothetical protein